MIKGKDISFTYEYEQHPALSHLNVSVEPGSFVVILGKNGCGKSTLVQHFNGLLPLQSGSLLVAGISADHKETLWTLRRLCGMVFQNPDNQFVSSVVEEDIEFGLKNFNVPDDERNQRIKEALATVDMSGYEKRSPHYLSGGQKQRIALAGILALSPKVIVLDEATAMIDPAGRDEVMSTLLKLHKKGTTLIMITHDVTEAIYADQVMVMNHGEIIGQGRPEHILTNKELMESADLRVPMPVQLFYDLKAAGIELSQCPLTIKEAAEQICLLH